MKRRFIKSTVLALTFALTFSSTVFAADATAKTGFENFTNKQAYTAGLFNDVKAGWVEDAVKSSYELNLMNGKKANVFDPNGDVTLGEAVSMAARVHEIYNGGDGIIDPIQGKWYAGAVTYAVAQGIIKEGAYTNYERAATRTELAQIFYGAIPPDQFKEINTITELPDVTPQTTGSTPIFALYNAGVVTGSDAYGTFNPDTNIKRAEAAAIITRVAVPAQRKTVTLKVKEETPVTEKQTFVSSDKIFEVTVPAGWSVDQTNAAPGSSLTLENKDGSLAFTSVVGEIEGTLTNVQLKAIMTGYCSELKEDFDNYSATEVKEVTINGVKGFSVDIIGSKEGNDALFRSVLLNKDDHLVFLIGVCQIDDAAATEKEAQEMINSFRFR